MELPFHLKALPPEALDVLRFFGINDLAIARADEITDGVGLSERTFGKVIRRLVTKGYLQMDGDMAYRLSDQGQDAVDELAAYDEAAPASKIERSQPAAEQIQRHLVLVAPRTVVAGQPTEIQVGFNKASDNQLLDNEADVVIRLSLINGEPTRPQEGHFQLKNQAAHQAFTVTPGLYKCLRVRVHVFQLGPNPDDINVAGGMYVDLDVVPAANPATANKTAYGADIMLTKISE